MSLLYTFYMEYPFLKFAWKLLSENDIHSMMF